MILLFLFADTLLARMMRYTSAGLVWAGPWNGPRGLGLRVAECNEGQSSCQGNTRIRTSWIVGSPSLKACDGRVADTRPRSAAAPTEFPFQIGAAGSDSFQRGSYKAT